MPRDLSDVLHYFLPEIERSPDSPAGEAAGLARRGGPRAGAGSSAIRRRGQPVSASVPAPAPVALSAAAPVAEAAPRLPLSVLGVPIGERELVHAAFTWSLALETARQGGSVAVVAPEADRQSPLWSTPRPGPREPELVYCPAKSPAELHRAAAELARARSRTARAGGIVFARLPPQALDETSDRPDSIRWLLVFSSPRRGDTTATLERLERWLARRPGLEVGVTIHGVRGVEEARETFDELARRCDERLGLALASYGLLIDELDVYRAIAAGRSIGETHPHSPAARALRDVARLIYEDARSRVLG